MHVLKSTSLFYPVTPTSGMHWRQKAVPPLNPAHRNSVQEIQPQKTDRKRRIQRNDHHAVEERCSGNIIHFLPP